MNKKKIRILFIGNSHTYFNDMPELVAARFREEAIDCEVTMMAHGGWSLSQHIKEPDTAFNIRYGHYDYVVLQEHSHPFEQDDVYLDVVARLTAMIRSAGSTPVIYMTWAKEDDEPEQDHLTTIHTQAAESTGSLLAPVGEYWWGYMRSWPNIKMYFKDGAHASEAGSDFAAKYIWDTIYTDWKRKGSR